MSGDGSGFEYPDTAGYPDGMGTLHEGVEESVDEGADAAATEAEGDLERFALGDEEDVEGV